jgi:glycosyltransferase involved in cell wall biosynthesis
MIARVLFVTRTTVYGGTEKHLVDLIQRLNTPDFDITILCFGADVFSPYLGSQSNVAVSCRGPMRALSGLTSWKAFRATRPDRIVFINGWLGLFPWHAYLAARLSGAAGVFAIEHSTADPAPQRVEGTGVRNCLRRFLGWQARTMWKFRFPGLLVTRTICVSDAVRERLVTHYGYPERTTITILNGVNLAYYGPPSLDRSHPTTGSGIVKGSDPMILWIGNLWRVKRVDILLGALALVAKGQLSWRCTIVGAGPLEPDLRAQAVGLGLGDVVQFVGRAEDVRPYLSVADLFVLSSENEGLPLVLGEAMAYGIPCIATDVGGNKEIIVHGETGLLVKAGAPEDLAEAIEHLLARPEERRRMGVNAYQRVHERFNIEDSMNRLKQILVRPSSTGLAELPQPN